MFLDTHNYNPKHEGSETVAELSLVWEGSSPIGHTNFSQPEYKILRMVARSDITNYNRMAHSRKLGEFLSLHHQPDVFFPSWKLQLAIC